MQQVNHPHSLRSETHSRNEIQEMTMVLYINIYIFFFF